jgi:hypothetical protein
MAKKKNNKKNNDKKLNKAAGRSVADDIRAGIGLGDELGFNNPLSRLDTNIPDDQRRYTESLMAMSDPSNPAYAGTRSAATSELLANAKNQMATAGKRSADMAEVLNLMKNGLAGLNSQENQAIREQAQREVDRKRQSALDQVMSASRMGGLRGGAKQAGMRAANRDAMMAQADMEQKNLISNIDIQDKRRVDYSTTLGREENSEFTRGNDAMKTYGNFLGGAEADEFDRADRTRTQYGDALNSRNDYFLDTSKVNLGQERTETAAKIAGGTGLAGMIEAERQRRRDARKGRSSGDGRDRSSNSNNGRDTQGGYDPMSYYKEVENIYKQGGAI